MENTLRNNLPTEDGRNESLPFVNPYRDLPDIVDAPDMAANEELKGKLERLKEFMRSEGLDKHLGIMLNHCHFDIYDDEVLVETCDEDARTLTIRPVKRNKLASLPDVKQTQWRVDVNGLLLGCVQYCINTGDGHSPVHVPDDGFFL